MDAASRDNPHHRNLEHARAQVIEMLTRQAVERELVSKNESNSGAPIDVVSQLVARQQNAALEQRLARFHPADIAFVLESLPPDAREMAWQLVRAERRGSVLLETSDAVRRSLIEDMEPGDIAAAFLGDFDARDRITECAVFHVGEPVDVVIQAVVAQRLDQPVHLDAGQCIQCAQRFVQQQQARVVHQGTGKRDALALAA